LCGIALGGLDPLALESIGLDGLQRASPRP
jgi:hypothetical protein